MHPMTMAAILWALCLPAWAWDEPLPPTAPPRSNKIKDPRAGPFLTLLYHNQKNRTDSQEDSLLVYARWDMTPSNQILGVKSSFDDEQVTAALRSFYSAWRPPGESPLAPPPKLILAAQNWGSGAGLYKPLKELSAEFLFDVYLLYPVVTEFEITPQHPTPNDRRLGEILKDGPPYIPPALR